MMQRIEIRNRDDNWNADIYNDSKYSHLQHHFEDEIFLHYIVPREGDKNYGKDVGEFGCGTGYLTEKILDGLKSATVTGFDNSDSMLTKAQERYAKNPNILFQKQDLSDNKNTPFHHQYSALISFFCFHWITKQVNALENVRNALEEHGTGYIFVPGPAHFPKTSNPNKKSYVDIAKCIIDTDPEFQNMFKAFNIERIKLSGDNYPEFINAAGLELSELIPINEEYHFSDFDDFSRFYQGILSGFLKFADESLSAKQKLQFTKNLCDKLAKALIQQGTYLLLPDGRVKSDEDFLLIIVKNKLDKAKVNEVTEKRTGTFNPDIFLRAFTPDNFEKNALIEQPPCKVSLR